MVREKPHAGTGDWASAGVPAYVKGWCCKASEGTMQRGFEDVGYLLAPHVPTFQPAKVPADLWRNQVRVLATEIDAQSQSGVTHWFRQHYPLLMDLIPDAQHQGFAKGVIERAAEPAGGSTGVTG